LNIEFFMKDKQYFLKTFNSNI